MENLGFPPALVDRLFPFHIMVDATLHIIQLGSTLHRLLPAMQPGTALLEHVDIRRPPGIRTFDDLIRQEHAVMVVTAKTLPLHLKGQVVPLLDGTVMCLILTPWMTDLAALPDLHLTLADFPPHSSVADFLFLLQAQQRTLAEVRDLNAHLDHQRHLEAEHHAARLAELATPLIPITKDVVVVPLIGSIDGDRGPQIMTTVADGVTHHHARVVLLDVTGVTHVDSLMAALLLDIVHTVRLLGADVMLTGIRPALAQTLVGLGVDMRDIQTWSTVEQGVEAALARLRTSGSSARLVMSVNSSAPQTNIPHRMV